MHHKAVFALAGVFLAIAIIVPTALFILQAQNDLIVIQNPTGLVTGNATSATPTVSQIQASHTTTAVIATVIEVVFGSLFVVAMYYGIKHIHPTH